MEKISLVMTSLNPNEFKINRALQSAVGFDSVYLHIDPATIKEPEIDIGFPSPWVNYRIRTEKTMGVGEAYNHIIKDIDAGWICCFCDDDFFDEKELAKLLHAIRAGDFVGTDVIHFACHVSGNRPYHKWGTARVTKENMQESNCIPAASFFRKSVWEKCGGFRGSLYHDWILWLRALNAGCNFKYFDAAVYWFMMRDDSAAVRQSNGMTFEEARAKVLEYVKS